MPVVISMLRGVNVGGHNKIRMEALRDLYESLGFLNVQTHIQSGNVVFRTKGWDLAVVAKRIGDGIEQGFGFRPGVIVRTTADLRDVIARNPFSARPGIDPSRLLVTFLSGDPDEEAREKVLSIKVDPEELRIVGREIYVHYPNGMGRTKLPAALIEKALKTSGTGRNWNTVTRLLEIAESLEGV
jgi:uncharacterized protein (DUF1697 family)